MILIIINKDKSRGLKWKDNVYNFFLFFLNGNRVQLNRFMPVQYNEHNGRKFSDWYFFILKCQWVTFSMDHILNLMINEFNGLLALHQMLIALHFFSPTLVFFPYKNRVSLALNGVQLYFSFLKLELTQL